ncbi:MAG TPA: hypothetical protein VIL36_10075 [Acidimicrobiales bacterium]
MAPTPTPTPASAPARTSSLVPAIGAGGVGEDRLRADRHDQPRHLQRRAGRTAPE